VWEPELLRLEGELRLATSPADVAGALDCFRQALAIARRQEARSWELRAASSLARLLIAEGRRDEARRSLAEIYGWFTDGFDTADLREAKGLLEELVAGSDSG
jgi:predicted ATPase